VSVLECRKEQSPGVRRSGVPRLERARPLGCGEHTPGPPQNIPIRASAGKTCPDLREIGSGGGGDFPQWFSQPPYYLFELFALEESIYLAKLGRLLWLPAFGLERCLLTAGTAVPVCVGSDQLCFGRRFPPGLCLDPLPLWGMLGCGFFSGAVPSTDRADQEVNLAERRTNVAVPRTATISGGAA